MSLTVQAVEGVKDLKSFVRLPYRLYRDDPRWVPPLISEEMKILNPAKNPCQKEVPTRLFLARRNGEVVGRVAALLSHPANRTWGQKNLRFGWFECIEDLSVARALLEQVEQWGRGQGMETLSGPQGFTDLDPEGMLIEGYEYTPTLATIYNPPYYPKFIEQLGFEKDADYIEFRSFRPESGQLDPKIERLSAAWLKRSNLEVRAALNRRELFQRIPEALEVLNEAYSDIYGFVPLTQEQLRYYFNRFMPLVDTDLVFGAMDQQDRLVALALSMPSLSEGLQKARGRLFPVGWFHLLKGMRQRRVLDLYLIGVRKAYQGGGVPLMIMLNLVKTAIAKGYQFTESNPMLENNKLMQGMHKYFDHITHKRRRVYKKRLID